MERFQQALAVTQQAVGQLQGMFKRLASKMEQDVQTLGRAFEKQGRDLVALTHAHNALVDEAKLLREELRALRGSKRAPEITLRPTKATSAVAFPPAYDGCTCACHTTPGIVHVEACCGPNKVSAAPFQTPPEPEDALWYDGAEDDAS